MSIHVIKIEKSPDYFSNTEAFHMEFGLDSSADVANLPALNTKYLNYCKPAPWSMAIDGATGNVYYLNSTGWHKVGA